MDLAATKRLVRNPGLRALMAAWTAFYLGSSSQGVLAIVFVFTAGGAGAVGVAVLLRVLPGGLLAPVAAALATSPRPQLHLAIGIGGRCLVTAATMVAVLSGSPVGVVLVLVAADSLVSSAVRPLHSALVVRLADTVTEAATANAATGSVVNACGLAGPALAGVTLGFAGAGWGFALPVVMFAAATVAALRIATPTEDDGSPTNAARQPGGSLRSYLRATGTGFAAIAANRPAAAAAGLFFVNVMLFGVWNVVSVEVAGERLGLGEHGITMIITLSGAGGLLGALAMLSIVGRRGLPRILAGAMLGWAVTLAAIGMIRLPVPGLALAVGIGVASAVVYAVAPTLVQRCVAKNAMVPAAASLQSIFQVGVAAGATLAPALIGAIGVTAALIATAGAATLVTALSWPQLRHADELSAEAAANLAVLRQTAMLAPLPALALEQLARTATRLTVPAGADVVREGDPGDRFYMICAGLADVTVDGHRVATLGRGGSFGEIALLDDIPRSATVTAREDLDLVVVDRGEFLGALSSETGAVGRMCGIARTRLATPPVEERLIELDRDAVPAGRSIAELLAAQPPLAALGAEALGELVENVRLLAVPDGAHVTREGDYGDAYYVIVDGGAQVLEDETVVRDLGPGDGFGEQAILRDVPRTATVRAVGDTTLVAVDRDTFQRARRAEK